jgi:hypothetical protein
MGIREHIGERSARLGTAPLTTRTGAPTVRLGAAGAAQGHRHRLPAQGQAVDDTAPQRRDVEEAANKKQQAGHRAPAHVAPPQAAFNEFAVVGAV